MNVRTVAVPAAGFSAVLSLLTLNISTPVGISFSKALTSSDVFNVYGTLDAATVDATNAVSIGQLAGTSGAPLNPALIKKMLEWPYVILQRVSGAGAGTFEAAGNLDAAPAVASTALPAVNAFSALLDMTAFDSTVRIGTSQQQLIGDVFDVYVTNDSTTNPAITGTAGAWYAGRISGGGESAGQLSSIVIQGFAYAFVRRVSGTTVGNMLAAGSSVPATSGTAWLVGGNTLPAGTQVLGTLNAGANLEIRAGGIAILDSDGSTTAIGNTEIGVPGNSLQLSAGAGGGQFAVTGAGTIDLQTATGTLGISSTGADITLKPGTTNVVRVLPRAAGAGDTSTLAFQALAGANFVGFKAPDVIGADVTWTLPAADAAGAFTSDGSGTITIVPPVKANFAAEASLTNAAAQFVPPSGAVTSLTVNLGVLQANAGKVSRFFVNFVGDAANVAGQTITANWLLNGAPIAGASVAGIATTAGSQAGNVVLGTPVALAAGDIITMTITPSAVLTAVCTNVTGATA